MQEHVNDIIVILTLLKISDAGVMFAQIRT